MTARLLLTFVHGLLAEQHGADAVEEMLHGKQRWRETLPAEEVVWEEVA